MTVACWFGGTQDVEPRVFDTIRVLDGTIAGYTYEEPFASPLGSHGLDVDLGGRYSNLSLELLARLLAGLRAR